MFQPNGYTSKESHLLCICNMDDNNNIQTLNGIFIIREATLKDIPQLVNVHVISWNATYPSYFPKPTVGLRTHQWNKAFELRENEWFCYVAESENGEIAGFATGNKFQDDELKYEAQLNKIHFLKPYQRLGLGRKLVGKVVQRFLSKGLDSMLLFADPENPNIRFYETLQGERILDKEGNFHGAYGWRNLKSLAALCNK